MCPPQKGRLVYSTGPSGSGGARTQAGAPPGPSARDPRDHQLRVRREKAGRAGKTVTTAGPLYLSRPAAAALLAELKRTCGSGGTLATLAGPEGAPAFGLELQGDHAERLVAELEKRGFPAKRAGG